MPNAFSITAANNTLNLDAQGHGEAAFTVSNLSKRALRGRARVIPLSDAKAEWFTLDGAAERDFPIDGTQQFTVRVAVSPGTPPGKPSFRLDTAATEESDELFAEGPTIGFEIKPPPPPPLKKPFPWWIIAVVALGVIGGVAAWLFLRPAGKTQTIPRLADLTVSEALVALEKVGISASRVKTEVVENDLREGPSQVIQSMPGEGKTVAPGANMGLIVSKEGAKVPLMTTSRRINPRDRGYGRTRRFFLSEAVKALHDCKLEVGDLLGDDMAGLVVSTMPTEATLVPVGTKVAIQMPGAARPLIPNVRADILNRELRVNHDND